jgi:tetratricopeptide (TPR) repeat protein
MSGPVEEKTVATGTGVSGANNSVQVNRDINSIGQQINQIILPSTSLQEKSIWFDVRKPVDSFTGRRRELENLHKVVQRNLEKNKHKLTVISQVTSISGLGGIGKSELAKMYAHEHCQDYDGNVIWINAATYAQLKESFHRLAKEKLNIVTKCMDGQEKDIKSIVQEVYKYFSKRKSLFIFDNADELRTEKEGDEAIDRFLPYFLSVDDNEPYIIITSRNQKWGETIKVLLLDIFTEEEAIEFIRKELGIRDDSQEKEIHQLAITLQYFPLALQQAVAYIKQTDQILKYSEQKFEIADYLKRYEEKARKLLNYNFPKDNSNCYTKTTFITWEVTLEKIKQNKYGQQALEVLETIAYFAPDNIPIKIFLKLVKGDTEKLGSMLQLPAQYSMFNLDRGVINIHRLVQQVIRLRLQEQQSENETLRKALEFIITPIEKGTAESSKCLPHAISVWNYASKHDDRILAKKLIEASSLITYKLIYETRYQDAHAFAIQTLELLKGKLKISRLIPLNTKYNMSTGLSNESINEIFKEVSKLIECVLGAEHSSTLLANHNFARMLHQKSKYEEALEIYEEVLDIEERVLGEEHPSTLTTRNNMALVLDEQGKYEEALRIYEEVFNIKKRVLGEEHLSTLTTRNNMALVLDEQGEYEEALEIYEEILYIKERVLGKEHPSTLTTRNNMALILDEQGKYKEALRIYEEVLNITERVLWADHPDTLTTRNNMALVLDEQGKYEESLRIYEEVFNMRKRVLGVEHPDTLTTRHCMAWVLNRQGKYEEALGIYEEVLNITERVLGAEHPDTLTTRNNMTFVIYRQGRYEEALEIYEEVLKIMERVLGAEHPDTLTTRNNMALVLDEQEKYEESLRIYEEVLNIQKRILGTEHPDTLTTRHCMAWVLNRQGKYEEALGIYQEFLNITERILGAEHPDTLTTRNNMAFVLDRQGKYEEALRIYEEVLNITERVLGAEHPDTLTTRNNMASTKQASIR